MNIRKVLLAVCGCLLIAGLLVAQGPRRGVGEGVPLPPAPPASTAPPRDAVPSSGQKPVSIDVDLVTVDVVVTDKNGGLVQGLTKDQFRVFDENIEQTVSNFSSPEAPLTVVVVIEFAQTFGYYYDNVITPAAQFVQTLRENDWAALVAFDLNPIILADFTKNKETLVRELAQLQYPATRETAVFDAVYDTLKRLDKVDGKKAVLLFSTGLNTISQRSLGEVLKKAEGGDTMIYAVGLGQFARLYLSNQINDRDNLEFLTGDNNIRAMAEATGGVAFYPRFAAEYPDIYDRISKEMRNQYSIGFVPKNVKFDGKLHKLRIELPKMDINRDGKLDTLTVRHKKGYYAPKR